MFRFPTNLSEVQQKIAECLDGHSYFVLRRFMRFVTVSEHPPPAGYAAGYISVHFMDTDAVIGDTYQLKLN